jgi:hypothetical protein
MAPKLIDTARGKGEIALREVLRVLETLWFAWRTRPRRPPRRPIVPPYINLRSPTRMFARIFYPIGLAVFCLIYGFFFALTAPYLIVPFSMPIIAMVLMAIWALPDRPHAPTKTIELFFSALLISLVLWPNYLALALPGLPWITVIRLTGFPMVFLFLVSLSTSREFRSELHQTLASVPWLWPAFFVFILTQFITLPFSKTVVGSLERALLQQVNWTCVFLVATWVCRAPGRVQRFVTMIVLPAIPIMAITILESREEHVVWSGLVPSFLKVDDPVAALILSSTVRGATGLYRSKATFSTPLGLAEYLALLTPFALHFIFGPYRFFTRLVGVVAMPLLFYCIRLTDARLGIVGYLVSVLLYLLYWGLLRLFRNRSDLFAAAVVYAYPAVFTIAGVAVMFVHRLSMIVFGSGAQAASNEARKNQLQMGLPKIMENPIGHGPGMSGIAMGYGAGEFITVDNYYLTLGMDYGVMGLFMFLAIFLLAISGGFRATLRASRLKDPEFTLLIPLSIALSAFLVIKLVFSQQDNHPLVFAMLGALVAMIWRVRSAAEEQPAVAPKPAHAPRPKPRSRLLAPAPGPAPARSPEWR